MACTAKHSDIEQVFEPSPPFVFNVNGLTLGYNDGDRIGKEISMVSLQLSGVIFTKSFAGNTAVRVIVVLDSQANGTTPSLFTRPNNILESALVVVSPQEFQTRTRYTFLYDRLHAITIVPGGHPIGKFNEIINLGGLVVNYNNGNTGTGADIMTNSIWCFVLMTQIPSDNVNPTVEMYTRLIYHDS